MTRGVCSVLKSSSYYNLLLCLSIHLLGGWWEQFDLEAQDTVSLAIVVSEHQLRHLPLPIGIETS